MEAILLVTTGVLFLAGIASWVHQEAARAYKPPKDRIPSQVYRIIERIRDRQFRGSDKVRLTLFRPDPDQPGYLRPIARVGWGRPSSKSTATFPLGEGLAGLAAKEDGILVARIGHFDDIEKARAAHRTLFHLTAEAAGNLSAAQLRSEVLVATSLMQGRIFKGVLCIDSLDPALVPLELSAPFWSSLELDTAELARVLATPQPTEISHEPLYSTEGAQLESVRFGPSGLGDIQPRLPLPRQGDLRKGTASA